MSDEELRAAFKDATLNLIAASSAYDRFAMLRDPLFTTRSADFRRAVERATAVAKLLEPDE